MIDMNDIAYIASPYWRWRKGVTYYHSQLLRNIMPTRENHDNFKSNSKTS